jgi:uncharacterized damage-inducible protein DinB
MSELARAFIIESRELLARDYLPKIRLACAALDDAALWWRANEQSNSIGNLILHLSGNVRQWIVSGVGGAEDARDRAAEFDRRDPISRDALIERLTRTLAEVDEVLAALPDAALLEPRRIQGRDVTVLHAVYHVVEHFAMHTGQIILLAKSLAPGAVRFYEDAGGLARPLWAEARASERPTSAEAAS